MSIPLYLYELHPFEVIKMAKFFEKENSQLQSLNLLADYSSELQEAKIRQAESWETCAKHLELTDFLALGFIGSM